MKICYRIYTQNILGTKDVVAAYQENFTVMEACSYYKGELEHSLVIEIVEEHNAQDRIKALAKHIKEINNQEQVLVTETALSYTYTV